MGHKVAVIGATGNVGREMLNIPLSANSPPTRGSPSPRAARWASRSLRDHRLKCDLEQFDFSGASILR
jgi:aspartate-semialdehyde dehydrogenase